MCLIVSILVFILLITGFVLIFDFSIVQKLKSIKIRDRQKPKKVKQKMTLKKKLQELKGHKKIDFLNRNILDAQQVLTKTGRAGKVKSTMTLCSVCAAAGFIISLLLGNLLLSPILTIGFYLAPLWFVKITAKNYKKHMSNELSTCLSVITASYIRNENIITAVEENMVNLRQPVKEPFSVFLTQVKYISSDVIGALRTLQGSIDNPIFQSWCTSLIQCQSDRNLKYTLQPIVNKFSQTKAIQAELETEFMKPLANFITMSLMVIGCIPGLYVINKEWFLCLTDTIWGQLAMTITALCVLFGINKAVNLSQPIEPKR